MHSMVVVRDSQGQLAVPLRLLVGNLTFACRLLAIFDTDIDASVGTYSSEYYFQCLRGKNFWAMASGSATGRIPCKHSDGLCTF